MVSKTTVAEPTIRTFLPSDLEAVLELMNACYQADDVPLRATTDAFLVQAHEEPGLAENQYLVAEADRRPVAFSDLMREVGTRLVSRLWIHPEWRSGDVGRLLIERRVELGSSFDEQVLDVPVRSTQHYKSALLEAMGFRYVRTWWIMRTDLRRDLPVAVVPAGFSLRTAVSVQDDQTLTALVNDVFAGHWGEGEHNLEEIRHDLSLPWFDPLLLVFAEHKGRPAGYVWSWVNPGHRPTTETTCALVSDLGVKAAYRRRGLGRALLLRALADLKVRGMRAAELEVDGPNASAKCLYESVGFQEHVELRWYRKQLRAPTGEV